MTEVNPHMGTCGRTLYVWVGHEVEEGSEQGVGGRVSSSKVKIKGVRNEFFLWKWRILSGSLKKKSDCLKINQHYTQTDKNQLILWANS